jgi:LacI family transcriptional regulator
MSDARTLPATLRDVARVADVSLATASRALTGARPVAPETKERVVQAARQIGYIAAVGGPEVPHGTHRRARATSNVGLVLANGNYRFSDPFWSLVRDGVERELARYNYHLRFAFVDDDLVHRHQRRLLSRTHVDGLILCGGSRTLIEALGRKRTVVVDDDALRWLMPLSVDIIAIEKRRAMYALVDHLVGLGKRRFAFLGPPVTVDERAEAFVQALARHNLSLDPRLHVEPPWTPDGAYPVATDLLRRHGHAIDALVCGSDVIAIGALRAAKERGVRVPGDMALTGWDDIPFARDLEPALTTVHVPKELVGAVAARRLIERIARPDLEPIIQMVPTTLVVRASCGARQTAP